jgi:hypothetical protein
MATDRRLVGIALLSVILATLMSIRAIAGWEVSGRPGVAPLPAAPQPGTCVGPAGMTPLVEPVETIAPGSCSGPHSAEIFYLGTMTGGDYPAGPDGSRLVVTPEFTRAQYVCHDQARRYVGEFDESAHWRVPPRLFVRVTVPSAAAWNTGQRWFTCQAVPRTDLDPVAFDGTMAGAQSAAHPPAILGSCAEKVGGHPVDCPLPHNVEQLTLAQIPIMMQAQRTLGSGPPACDTLAATIIGRADPTFGGRISIVDHVEPLQRSCWAVAVDGSRLTGSLIGHGEQPLGAG